MAMSAVYTNFGGILLHESRGGTERQYVSDPLGSLVDKPKPTRWNTGPYDEPQTETGNNTSPGIVLPLIVHWPHWRIRSGERICLPL